MKRSKLGVDDFEHLKVIGRGAFGEVGDHHHRRCVIIIIIIIIIIIVIIIIIIDIIIIIIIIFIWSKGHCFMEYALCDGCNHIPTWVAFPRVCLLVH